ncbi:UPF0544 C5orf45-like protein [Chlorella sorokiniana]|uniref:UPF0544 C5orf45-like protein n=1 Tax=Chlorella sorokiniana TaxID=3076 RepID=A0A2P6TSJ0_CHLSO|nr:UPF0544 C5orf45-like protein [Chlorella sorokiniana]|eukprot:PRW57031.1 UPF0544 C5orf45-like protein [Chlorella sorokiniana]
MPQTWLVVQCYQCRAFQVDQEKQAKKWACKLCGEKQSLQRVFARSHSAKDCRLVVQQYNTARGAVEEEEAERALQMACLQEEEGAGGWGEEWEQEEWQQQKQQQPQRWQAFQDQEDEEDEGWTVAAPERPAGGKQKRGMGQAGGGSKRRRQAEQEQEAGDQQLGQHRSAAYPNMVAG